MLVINQLCALLLLTILGLCVYVCGGALECVCANVCVCVCMCKCTYSCICTNTFRPEDTLRCRHLGTIFFLRWDLSSSYSSPNRLGWLTRKPQRPTCLCLLQGTGITSPHIMRDFCLGVCFVCFAYHSFWGLNSSPHGGEANTFPTWPFLQSCFKVIYLLIEFSQTKLEKNELLPESHHWSSLCP